MPTRLPGLQVQLAIPDLRGGAVLIIGFGGEAGALSPPLVLALEWILRRPAPISFSKESGDAVTNM
ncbi:MAG TPA: hypothetical protein VMN36_09035 [Verrucomicrobiales bacterium]|nr:hypothetical protein [Verrucomicrobiales bacterium]